MGKFSTEFSSEPVTRLERLTVALIHASGDSVKCWLADEISVNEIVELAELFDRVITQKERSGKK